MTTVRKGSGELPVLVGCEESQTITTALRRRGVEAYSCDLLPTRGNPDWHIHGDVMDAVSSRRWSMIILHPSCTEMALCANGTYGRGKPKHHMRIDALKWTIELWHLAKLCSDRVALENPKSMIFPELKRLGANVQWVQPWMFGHPETKATGFALHGLPELVETDNVYRLLADMPAKEKHKIWYMSPGPNRQRDRSVTYPGIADAIADQWGLL